MKILESRVYRGANYWAPVPVIRLSVELGHLEARRTDLGPDFCEKLTIALPAMREHQCSCAGAGVPFERACEQISLGHLVQHLAHELQKAAGQRLGAGLSCFPTHPTDEVRSDVQQVIFSYEQPDVGIAAGNLAIRLLESALARQLDTEFDFARGLNDLFNLARALSYGPSTRALVTEAKRRDIPVQRLEDTRQRVQLGRSTRALRSLLQLGYGKYQRRIWAPYIATESHLATDIALNKDLTNRLVRNAGLPAPQSIQVKDEEAAVVAARKISYPVVLKPLDGNHGRGVSVNLRDEAAVRANYPLALRETHTGTVLVENFLPGNTYRILVVGGRAIAVTEEVPAHVVGDGSHTLRQLVKLTNADPRRGHGSESLLVRIRLDEAAIALAQQQGYGPDEVPPAGKPVQLVRAAHISLGGISVDRTDEIHPDNAMIAEQAALVVGLQIAGIDLIAPDIGRSVRETGGGICEVNAGPGLGLHAEPVVGKPRDVARPIIELLFPPGAVSRVPIVAVTGATGKTTTTRIIAHILKVAGRRLGLANADGMYLDDTRFVDGDLSGPDSAQLVLRNPAIEGAVLEIGYEGILGSGLGYDRADVAVITQISDRPPGLNGRPAIDPVRLNAVVANSVGSDGTIVLNADDQGCAEIGKQANHRILYFSSRAEHPLVAKHVGAGGRAVVLQSGSQGSGLYSLNRGEAPLLLEAHSPIIGDDWDRARNSLAATAACVALGIDSDSIKRGLFSFGSQRSTNAKNA